MTTQQLQSEEEGISNLKNIKYKQRRGHQPSHNKNGTSDPTKNKNLHRYGDDRRAHHNASTNRRIMRQIKHQTFLLGRDFSNNGNSDDSGGDLNTDSAYDECYDDDDDDFSADLLWSVTSCPTPLQKTTTTTGSGFSTDDSTSHVSGGRSVLTTPLPSGVSIIDRSIRESSHGGRAVNMLKSGGLGIYGRQLEIVKLEDAINQCSLMSNDATTMPTNTVGNEREQQMASSTPSIPITGESSRRTTYKKQVVWLSGYSGVGKSALVLSLRDIVKERVGGGLFVMGKFEQSFHTTTTRSAQQQQQQQQQHPYIGFRMICDSLSREIISMKDKASKKDSYKFDKLKEQILFELGTELIELVSIFPSLDRLLSNGRHHHDHPHIYSDDDTIHTLSDSVLHDHQQHGTYGEGETANFGNVNSVSRNRFMFAFRTLIRVISSFSSPLVMALDDLQWADVASLDLLECLLADRDNTNLMVIGTYRSNEVDDCHVLTKTLRHVDETATENKLTVTAMELGNLDDSAVYAMLLALLSPDQMGSDNTKDRNRQEVTKDISRLAELCHKKTGGNAFYLIHYISMLYDNQLLQYNFAKKRWTWDVKGIQQITKATENVVDLLKQKMSGLSTEHQQLLKYASFLGSVFEKPTIFVLWKDYKQQGEKSKVSPHSTDSNGTAIADDDVVADGAANIPTTGTSTLSNGAENVHEERTRSKENNNCTHDKRVEPTTKCLNEEEIKDSLVAGLKFCEQAGFLESAKTFMGKTEKMTYRWVHDKLQEAAMDLVSSERRLEFSQHVATVLSTKLSENEVEGAIFVIVNRFNEGSNGTHLDDDDEQRPYSTNERRIELARLNLRAANKAVAFSAFESAASYCRYGIRLLPSDRWEEHYDLTLKLYSLGAETEGFLGNVETMEQYCNEVLGQEKNNKRHNDDDDDKATTSWMIYNSTTAHRCSPMVRDKFRVYNVMMNSISNRNQPGEAATICLDVLRRFGIKFPTSKAGITLRIVYNIAKIKSTLKSRSVEEVQNLPTMEDPIRLEQMGLINQLGTYCYFSGNGLLPLAVFKALQWTLEYGFCSYSPLAFAGISLILGGVLDDGHASAVYGNYALMLLSRLDADLSRNVEARTMFIVYAFSLHWTEPAQNMMKPLLRAYQIGMQNGDTENAMFAIYHYIVCSFRCGRSLATIEHDCRVYGLQMKELKRERSLDDCNVTLQMV